MIDRLFDVLTQIVHWFLFWTVIDDDEAGIVLRLGRFSREMGPGFHLMAPFGIDVERTGSTVPGTEQLRPQSITTADGVSVVVTPVITWRIVDMRKFQLGVSDGPGAVLDCVVGAVGTVVRQRSVDDALSHDCARKILSLAKRRAKRWGVEIEDLQFADLVQAQSFRLFGSAPQAEAEASD